MHFPSIRARLSPRPIVQYALALFFVMVSTLAVLAAFVFHDTARLKEQIEQSDEKLAHQELDEAIALLTQQAESAARALTQWDEARQQLENPVYYAYWRNSRALVAGVLPKSIDAVDLYNFEGRNLSTANPREASMPAQVDMQNMQPFLLQENGQVSLYYFSPFYRGDAQAHRVGYAGLKLDFLKQLAQLRRFRYLDMESLQVAAREGERIPLHELVPVLRFRTIANPETRA